MRNILDYYSMVESVGSDLTKTNAKKLECHIASNFIKKKLVNITKCSQYYGINITFKSKYHDMDPIQLHRLFQKKLIKSNIWKKNQYLLFPEFSPKSGNLHYHGVVYDCYQHNVISMQKMCKREFGPQCKVFLTVNCKLCEAGIDGPCSYLKQNGDKGWCWTHYITKDVGKTGLWTIYKIY